MRVLSAHRTPDRMTDYARSARASAGCSVIVAGAGGAAHLPGMIAASTTLPVIGVPVQTRTLNGLDSLLSIVQMPGGVPVATVAIGGAKNAGLLAVQILATSDLRPRRALAEFRISEVERVEAHGRAGAAPALTKGPCPDGARPSARCAASAIPGRGRSCARRCGR